MYFVCYEYSKDKNRSSLKNLPMHSAVAKAFTEEICISSNVHCQVITEVKLNNIYVNF